MSVDVAAAVPVGNGRKMWGRTVVRLDAASGRARAQYSSARAAKGHCGGCC
jgi:hypothetical protein